MDRRDRLALEHLWSGVVQDQLSFPRDVGDKTIKGLLEKGWIEYVDDRKTYRITPAGRASYSSG